MRRLHWWSVWAIAAFAAPLLAQQELPDAPVAGSNVPPALELDTAACARWGARPRVCAFVLDDKGVLRVTALFRAGGTGTLAQEEQARRGTRFFDLTILLEKNDERLRPGMSARVEIEVEQRARALWVPVEAVFEREGQSLAFVRTRGGFRPRELVLGPSNGDFVVVERGLTPGERVALRDPGAPPGDFSPASPAP